MTEHIHDRLVELLEAEEPDVRRFLGRALVLAQNPRLSAEGLASKLQRELVAGFAGDEQ